MTDWTTARVTPEMLADLLSGWLGSWLRNKA